MKLETIKDRVGAFVDSVAEGWHHLRSSAANALTHFKPESGSPLPARERVDDPFYLPSRSWSMLGVDLFEDERRLVARLEVPGMNKQDMRIDVVGDALILSGEKHFSGETTEGRWRVMQCAYGSFRRVVPLPVAVQADEARASYTNGILRVELPKAQPGQPKATAIRIDTDG